jgi:hypothetical protein
VAIHLSGGRTRHLAGQPAIQYAGLRSPHQAERTVGERELALTGQHFILQYNEEVGTLVEETRAFAMKALERRLKVIGLAPVA